MKKISIILLSFMLLTTFGFSAAKKYSEKPGMLVFGDVGLAVFDYKGLFVDGGFQYGFMPNLFAEGLFEYYFSPFGSGINSSAWGLNLNGVYKLDLLDGIKLFGKAGVCLIHTSFTFMGVSYGDSDIGFNAGGGLEYALNETMGLRGGATFKISFAEGEAIIFSKLYAGFYYGL